jgi:phosphatidylinositol kinase/protein kinase (PI-3  family)
MSVLIGNRDAIMMLLECFKYSPLASWKKESDDELEKFELTSICEFQLIGIEVGILCYSLTLSQMS